MALDIKDIIKESKNSRAEAVGNISQDEMTGILSQAKQLTNQPHNIVTDKGVGSYGLTLNTLQNTGIVKMGINNSGSLNDILADNSVFTGKYSINTLNILLNDEKLQQQIYIDNTQKNMTALKQQGIITGNESKAELAGFTQAAGTHSVSDIKDYKSGTASVTLSNTLTNVFSAGKFAVNLINSKVGSLLNTVKGIGGGATTTVKSSTDIIKTPALYKELDNFIGSKRVPSAVKGSDSVIDTSKKTASLNKEDLF